MAYGKGNMSRPMPKGGKKIGDGYSGTNSKPGYGSNANVRTSRLNTGGDKKWKGTRGKKSGTSGSMSYK